MPKPWATTTEWTCWGPKGNWRWIGTRTILFDPEIRFPQATTYNIEIPAGTKSANGGVLAKATTFSFETPAATVVSEYPTDGPYQLDVPMSVVMRGVSDELALAELAASPLPSVVPSSLSQARPDGRSDARSGSLPDVVASAA